MRFNSKRLFECTRTRCTRSSCKRAAMAGDDDPSGPGLAGDEPGRPPPPPDLVDAVDEPTSLSRRGRRPRDLLDDIDDAAREAERAADAVTEASVDATEETESVTTEPEPVATETVEGEENGQGAEPAGEMEETGRADSQTGEVAAEQAVAVEGSSEDTSVEVAEKSVETAVKVADPSADTSENSAERPLSNTEEVVERSVSAFEEMQGSVAPAAEVAALTEHDSAADDGRKTERPERPERRETAEVEISIAVPRDSGTSVEIEIEAQSTASVELRLEGSVREGTREESATTAADELMKSAEARTGETVSSGLACADKDADDKEPSDAVLIEKQKDEEMLDEKPQEKEEERRSNSEERTEDISSEEQNVAPRQLPKPAPMEQDEATEEVHSEATPGRQTMSPDLAQDSRNDRQQAVPSITSSPPFAGDVPPSSAPCTSLASSSSTTAEASSEATAGSSELVTGSSEVATGSSEATTGSSEATTGSSEATTGSSEVATGSSDATAGRESAPEPEERRRRQPDLSAVPTRSNLKRKSPDDSAESAPKRPRRGIQFAGVTVFYFPRAQGFTCIPSQGGSTLGMADAHSHVERFSLTDHVNEQRLAHRQLLTRLRLKQRKLQPAASSSEESDAGSEEGSDVSDSELDVDSYFFLRPVSTRQRRALLRASGVRKIEPLERDECRDIRTSREFCGCACKVVCRPDVCQCAGAGIKCQVDRQNFPCGCTRDGCQNPTGRIEFNPSRVRSHFVETIMREQPPPAAAGGGGGGTGAGAGGWASCGWQKAAGCAAAPGQQYMAEQEFPSGYGGAGGGAGGFDLAAPYQEDSSYSENSDGSSDGSYDASAGTAAAAAAAAAGAAYQPPQTQSHYSSFSFEGGLQNYGPPPAPAPPYPAAMAGYQQSYPACQSYGAGAHPAYPPPQHYSYPFTKYPTPGPGPGGGGAGAAPGGAAAAAAGYPPACTYPAYPTVTGCSYEPAPPVYVAAGPYEPAACSFPSAAPVPAAGGFSAAPAPAPAPAAAAFPPEPAAPAPAGDERKYTDLVSRQPGGGGQLDSLADLLQDKFGAWPPGGAAGAAAATYCGTPPSEDSGVEADDCAAKHASQPDENIGEIMKKTMVESVSA